jgi:hypothetical protein
MGDRESKRAERPEIPKGIEDRGLRIIDGIPAADI